MKFEILSYGGGVQTVALLILNATGRIKPRATHAVFSDTGSELLGTYKHLKIMTPYAAEHGIEFVTVKNEKRWRLHEYQVEKDHILVPTHGIGGGLMRRQCTGAMKIQPIRRWLRSQGATEAVVQLGISWDEIHRAKVADVQWARNRWPLIELKISRAECIKIIEDAGIRIPPKSACFICPFRRLSGWTELKEKSPDEFQAAIEFEAHFEGEYLTNACRPLDEVIGAQSMMFEDDECGGYCWT